MDIRIKNHGSQNYFGRNFVLVALIALFLLCLMDIQQLSAFTGEIKIGSPVPFSGVYAEGATLIRHAEEQAATEWNDKGGVLGKKLVILREDTQQQPAVGARKTVKLIDSDNVTAVFGAQGSNIAAAQQAVALQKKTLFLIHTAYSSSLTGESCNRYTFRIGHNSQIEAAAFGKWIIKNVGKKVYFIASDYLWGTATTEDFLQAVKEAGGEPMGKTFFPLGAKDLSPYFATIRQVKPEILFVTAAGNDARLALTQIHQFGLDKEMKIVGPATLLGAEILSTVGDASEGVISVTPWDAILDIPKSKKFVEGYKKVTNGTTPSVYAMHAYEAIDLYAQAVSKAGSTDTEAVIKALRGFTYDGPQGVNVMRPEDN
ncbi:MAG: ABC transporter substrate-binding protein, partial [Candidatus Tectomicrobia bacterium]|nr:ABC transporter substrate-binding protein [Candidatus Tectomicrobia bacterium]